ncbi:sugar ABC transporter permease [Thalassobacillus devorans]|uniref:Sugar ABC transporter permease n=1 Tax=Thalassobacillus devorans TaxID=279813 RepID=A0ABQ1NJ08_9BACI|nr:carbohydrate ABC transporter permease [Thalassobacillus devorans]NIK27256.1 multiple sugar transport system permease protein [Thalassobacillus devorans]GGC76212.1 sugar ABC transporter permease [Thalassobacillus devorans]
MSHHNKTLVKKIGIYFSYAVITLFFLFPLLWIISMSFKTSQELFAIPPTLIPETFAIENYRYVLETTGVVNYLKNSAIIVFFTVIFTLLVSVPAAYALSRFKFKLKVPILITVLMTQMISAVVISIPLYRLFSNWNLLNNYIVLIIVYVSVVLPLATWFLKGYFDTIPAVLDEAATIDGANRWQFITKILFPTSMPGIVSVTILVAVQSWSQFVIPFILLDDESLYPVSVGVMNLQSTQQAVTTHYLAAGSVISVIPVIILFVVFQRLIVGALTSGAVKG